LLSNFLKIFEKNTKLAKKKKKKPTKICLCIYTIFNFFFKEFKIIIKKISNQKQIKAKKQKLKPKQHTKT